MVIWHLGSFASNLVTPSISLFALLFCQHLSGSCSHPRPEHLDPTRRDPINQWLCPRHANQLHQQIAFLTKKTKWPSNGWSRTPDPSTRLNNCSPHVAMASPKGRYRLVTGTAWPHAAIFNPGSSHSRNHLGDFCFY